MRNRTISLLAISSIMSSALAFEKMPFEMSYNESTGPIFYPKKHTVMSYAKQNRLAKQGRRKNGRKK